MVASVGRSAMSKKHNVNRRNVLKKLGAGGIAAAGIPSAASANRHNSETGVEIVEKTNLDTDNGRVEQVLNSPAIQTISEKVDGINISSVNKYELNLDGKSVTAFEIETGLGKLQYAEEADDAKLVIDDVEMVQEEAPKVWGEFEHTKYGLPVTVDITILSSGSSIEIVRSVSSAETEELKQAIGDTGDTFATAYNTDIEGYKVFVIDEETINEYVVATDNQEISHETVEPLLRPQANNCGCIPCLEAVASKAGCYVGCFAATGGIGGAACLICISLSSLSIRNCDGCNPPCCLNCCNFNCL